MSLSWIAHAIISRQSRVSQALQPLDRNARAQSVSYFRCSSATAAAIKPPWTDSRRPPLPVTRPRNTEYPRENSA
jgi:hypothetical protein